MGVEIENKVKQIQSSAELQKVIRAGLQYFRKELPIEFEYHKLPKKMLQSAAKHHMVNKILLFSIIKK